MTDAQEQSVYHHLLKALYLMACNGQTEPDGRNCAICGDTDHQAPECQNNAFNRFKKEKI